MINKTVEMQVKSGKAVDLSVSVMRKCLNAKYGDIVRPMNSLIATGNLQSKSGLGLMQTSGLAVMAEKINFWRFMSHFRAVHRGSFFAEMKTTTCRKLYPEAWGFLCPVHTPDGAPCGLLNHLSEMCLVTNNQESVTPVVTALQSLGMEGHKSLVLLDFSKCYTVILDGKVIGHIRDSDIHRVISELRTMKATQSNKISATLEIGFVPKTTRATQYPGLFLFSNPARMVRPVYNLKAQCLELIGTFEQPYLEVCVAQEEAHPKTTHQELSETSILSVLASMIPFPDFNQSPRNMYACQMGKQTMGTASHTLKFRSDSKMYATNCGQTPLVRPTMHDHYQLDEYPMGTNAVVAVISYTGYDMEDALILNKSSVERGFKHGQITKTVVVDLRELAGISSGSKETVYVFGSIAGDASSHPDKLDKDGLPFIGTKLEFDDPMCSYIDTAKGVTVVKHYASTEVAYVQDVVLLGSDNGKDVLQKIAIKLYIPRVPIIGDKFANRHGQKGVSSFLWPQESMPFTTSGLTPDIIFNPHGFPSRMTIGMMLESMAGKTGSHFGTVHDATPFTFSEDEVASEHFGTLLEKAGYNYYGTERMYSGVSGQELVADIFVGVIYYIRLRHMVGDKYQVRSTGPIDQMTHQPIKGRKRAGGIRFGEMERDSLLAHGTSFLLQDRLFNCSDKSSVYACSKCMSIVSTFCSNQNDAITNSPEIWSCRVCNTGAHVKLVSLPYVLKYLVAELASVNIKCNFKTT
ncbi:DNA-directed RNA polymerase I subunit RPA2 [Halotydeus destructor]|nr:DNA-directed RNA polymerase I subunit RPA2 [Halotydeus destructor]